MILIIDNYDSFTFNLYQYVLEFSTAEEVCVRRNDQISLEQVEEWQPSRVIISPGPGKPSQARISNDIVRAFAGRTPILGVCLGHQCIAEIFGADVVPARRLMHGKTSDITHDGQGVFKDLPGKIKATRYHSLIVDPVSVPDSITITAWTEEREIMGLRIPGTNVEGVQFHPESILTEHGKKMIKNFLKG